MRAGLLAAADWFNLPVAAGCPCEPCRRRDVPLVSPAQLELLPAAELRLAAAPLAAADVETWVPLPAGLVPVLPDGLDPISGSRARQAVLATAGGDRAGAVRRLTELGLAVALSPGRR